MSTLPTTPFHVGKLRSLPYWASIVTDPMATTRRLHSEYGPFVTLEYPISRQSRSGFLGLVANSELYRTMFSATDTWRGVNINFRGFKRQATRRLSYGMTRLRGARHEHYRRLISPPLKRPAVAAMSGEMAALADDLIAAWPRDTPLDLLPLTEHLMQELAVGLLFGADRQRALPIARMITRQGNATRFIPGRDYLAWLRVAAKQERAILEWAAQKRGHLDDKDIMSILANNMDERGAPPSREIIGGLLSFIFGATFETCQNGLAWTLILLAQHPKIASMLADEIGAALAGSKPTIDRVGALPLLDAVINEAMRLLPPVPLQFRKSTAETTLGSIDIRPGTRILISGYLVNRNPELYEEPDCFLPERWRRLAPLPYDYTVFGAGAHMCPGAIFANQIAKIALSAILSRNRVEMVRGARIDYRNRVTLSPYPRVPMIFRDLSALPVAVPVAGRIHELVRLPAGN